TKHHPLHPSFLLAPVHHPPPPTPSPYTTLFRSPSMGKPPPQSTNTEASSPRHEPDGATLAQRERRSPRRGTSHDARTPHDHRHRSEEHTSELQSLAYLVCRLLLEKKKDYLLR